MLREPLNDFFGINARNCCPCGSHECSVGIEPNVDVFGNSLGEFDSLIHHPQISGEPLQKDRSDLVPYVGQTFRSDDDAYVSYCNFSKQNGFLVRHSHSLGSKNHRLGIYRRKYVCHRAGLPQPKAKVPEESRQRNRKSSRCKCSAKVVVCKDIINGITQWKVIEFDNTHNHELLKQNEVRFLPAYRHIGSLDQERIMTLSKAGCTMKVIMRILELEKGVEPGMLPFMECDARNLVFSKSYIAREDDAMGLLMMCKNFKDQVPAFCYDYKLDENQKLEHIIWSFGNSTRAYADFGDVVVFATTYRINRYDMPLGVWVGIDNLGNSIFFGCVLLRNEKSSSFQWELQKFLSFMDGKYPKTILTDQDLALTEAITIELPTSKHAFCIWHITSKLPTWFSSILGVQFNQFKAEFHRIYNLESVENFEQEWSTMVAQFDLHTDRHIDLLFAHRACWALPYLRDYFFAGMTTTGRLESINAFLKKFLHARTSLKDFIEQVGVAVITRNQAGEEANMRQKVHNSMLKTCIAQRLKVGVGLLGCKQRKKYFALARNLSSRESCVGTPFPERYLITRWRCESSLELQYYHHLEAGGEHQSPMFHSHVALLQVESSKTKERAEFVEKELERVITLVISMPVDVENSGDNLERCVLEDISNDIIIKNPDQSKTKGRPKAKRPIGGIEAAKKTRYCKVPNCGGTGHDSRNCPNKR